MFTKWVGQAWEDLHKEQGHVIIQTFRKLGLSFAVDGSEDHEISVKDIKNLQVGDWRLPSHIEKEDVYNALDPDEQRKKKKAEDQADFKQSTNTYIHETEEIDTEDEEVEIIGAEDEDSELDGEFDVDDEYEEEA